ncbi:glycosyltransferase family 9 protein, partial [Salmonella enterica]|uniref:glycosyltransferase family 9 protein n=1 Tax=Salmonella enterica TaxID=28901 RepID=UPI003D27C50E
VKALLGSTHSEAPLVVLAPFTRWPSKHWPLDYWPVLMRELLALPVRLAVVGAPADAAAVVAMQAQLPAAPVGDRLVNLAGKTDWP